MSGKSKGIVSAIGVFGFVIAGLRGQPAVAGWAPALAAGQAAHGAPAAEPAGKTAAQAFKNIQVLKDIPAEQLFPTMQFITASLGVECNFCHVQGAFDKDDKEEKKTARKMMTMMFAINKDNFGGEREVTCYSCHRGSAEPVGTPIISDEAPNAEGAEGMNGGGANAPAMPTAEAILDKYVQAIGGTDALHKINTRVEKGTLSGFGPAGMPVEVFAKAPDARVTVVHGEHGENVTAYNGQVGWMSGMGPARPITGGALENEKRNADFYFAADIKTRFQQIRAGRRTGKVGDRECYILLARNPGQPPVRFYFDKETGLLLREMRFVETALGRNPSEVDYADYHDEDGVKIPLKWTIARPGGRFTIQIASVQQNVPIDDAKFAAPPPPPAEPGGKPGAP
ncbi:MAG TPA: c-type cytochrome [Terriglobia bacterium]|nr:c-type cytochrome [Terriglobia bacterium]